MSQVHTRVRDRLVRWVLLCALGFVGTALLLFTAAMPSGAAYSWLMTGSSPIEQVREGGIVVLVFWPVIGVFFAWVHVAGAFMSEPSGPWGVAGVTPCLAALWGIAMGRGKAYRHTVVNERPAEATSGRTRA
jgi:hypothetical protein